MAIDTAIENQKSLKYYTKKSNESKDSFTTFQLPPMGHCDCPGCVNAMVWSIWISNDIQTHNYPHMYKPVM